METKSDSHHINPVVDLQVANPVRTADPTADLDVP